LAINVRGQHCLVVGGGSVGARKAQTLERAGATVTVVAPTVTRVLAEQIDAKRIRWVNDTYREEHLEGVFLVVAATNNEALNASIAEHAAQRGALVCDASSAERSQVIFGALHRESDATIAVFTDGRDPAHARRTRDELADLLNRGNRTTLDLPES
jgi:siroheme synthase-like protein